MGIGQYCQQIKGSISLFALRKHALYIYALAFVINYLDDCNIRRERGKLVLSNYNSLNTQIKINDTTEDCT